MTKLTCMRHRTYTGSTAPDLSCKTCCHMYVETLKRKEAQKDSIDTRHWLSEKTRRTGISHYQHQQQRR